MNAFPTALDYEICIGYRAQTVVNRHHNDANNKLNAFPVTAILWSRI